MRIITHWFQRAGLKFARYFLQQPRKKYSNIKKMIIIIRAAIITMIVFRIEGYPHKPTLDPMRFPDSLVVRTLKWHRISPQKENLN